MKTEVVQHVRERVNLNERVTVVKVAKVKECDKQIEAGYDGQHSLVGTPRQSHYCGKVLCWAWLGTVQQKDYCWM